MFEKKTGKEVGGGICFGVIGFKEVESLKDEGQEWSERGH